MKKLLFFTIFALFVFITATAQFVGSKSYNNINAIKNFEPDKNYNRFFLGYAPLKFIFKGDGPEFSKTGHGFNIGWLGGYKVTKETPLYLETGLAMNANFGQIQTERDKLLYFEIPLNITYRYYIKNTKLIISPYLGLHLKVNVLARDVDGVSYFDYDSGGYGEYDFDDLSLNRCQIGMQLGANIDYEHFFLGIGWNRDFTPIGDVNSSWPSGKGVTSGFRLNVGVIF